MRNKILLWIIGGITMGTLFVFLYILLTKALWNLLVPEIFNGPIISFWQTAGLILLVCMFSWISGHGKWFGKGHHHHCHDKFHKHVWKSKWDEKWCSMNKGHDNEQNNP